MLRKHLEGLSSQELDLFIERLEESYKRKNAGDENAEKCTEEASSKSV